MPPERRICVVSVLELDSLGITIPSGIGKVVTSGTRSITVIARSIGMRPGEFVRE